MGYLKVMYIRNNDGLSIAIYIRTKQGLSLTPVPAQTYMEFSNFLNIEKTLNSIWDLCKTGVDLNLHF